MSRLDIDSPLHWTIIRVLTYNQIQCAKETAYRHMKWGKSPEFRDVWEEFFFALREHEDGTSPNEFAKTEELA